MPPAERTAGYPCTKKAGFDLGTLPTHTNDNYRDFYLGLDQGGDAYDLVYGGHYLLRPPGTQRNIMQDGSLDTVSVLLPILIVAR